MLEGLTLRGGLQQAIRIRKVRACTDRELRHCGLGAASERQRFDRDGKYYTETGSAINWGQRNPREQEYRHRGGAMLHPRSSVSTANSWYYSPSGRPAGRRYGQISIDRLGGTTTSSAATSTAGMTRWRAPGTFTSMAVSIGMAISTVI